MNYDSFLQIYSLSLGNNFFANSGQYILFYFTINRMLDIKFFIYVFRVKVTEAFPLKPRFEVPLVLQQVAETWNFELLDIFPNIMK